MSRNVPDISQSWRFYVKSVVFVSLFYVNYYIIIDYCLGKKNWALRLCADKCGGYCYGGRCHVAVPL